MLPAAAVLLASGLLLAAALTSTRREAPVLDRQRTALEAQIAARTQEVDGLRTARQRLRQQVAAAEASSTALGSQIRTNAAVSRGLAASAGAAAVAGPGVTVRLADAPPAGGSPLRITDTDLAQVVNVLWASGAEAVAVNGVRLTVRTAIRSAGDAVLVNFRPVSSPYLISAVGSPDTLGAGFAASPVTARLRTGATVYGTGVGLSVAERLMMPAGTGLAVTAGTAKTPTGAGRP